MEALETTLFAVEGDRAYAVIDGASCEDLLAKLDEFRPEHVCLYAGELEPDVREVAPYLVRLEAGGEFTHWLLKEGWGKHWGIFVTAPTDLRTLRKHFRTILLVRSPENKSLYFRYYDPRVIRMFLPTCEPPETRQIFGPCTSLLAENEDPTSAVRWTYKNGAAALQLVALEK